MPVLGGNSSRNANPNRSFSGVSATSVSKVAPLGKVTTIARLSFTGAGLTDQAMKEIAKLTNLTYLELVDCAG